MLALASCSDDYLDTAPQDSINTSTVFSNTEMLDGAVNGLSLIMSESYSSSGFSRQGNNGEGTIILWYGAYLGGDAQYSNYSTTKIITGSYFENSTDALSYYPWYYYYRLIANANAVILHADEASGSIKEKEFYKAQALTYRAHAYSQLAQFYCKRWCDSRNGASRGVPLRLDDSTGDIACSSLADVYAQIYADLDEALSLYASSGMTRGAKYWRPDANVAHAIYARTALSKEDWQTAATHAHAARQGHPMMTYADYSSGFNTPNDEWLWGTYHDETENLGVYGLFAYIGANTASSKGYKNIGTISKELIEQIPEDDLRRGIYMIPADGESGWSTSDSGRANKGNFFTRMKNEFAGKIDSKNTYIYAYMSVKFQTIKDRSIGSVCILRGAEMLYAEAEALCHLGGQDSTVRSLLEEALAPYQSGYTCNLSGDALLNEVKLYKRFDLWAEGRGWMDQKRWNEPLVRHGWDEGGNWHPNFSGTGSTGGSYGTADRNHWCIVIPSRETDYNKLINNNVEPDNWSPSSAE